MVQLDLTMVVQFMPGYGLYDRALGACYLNGLIEAIEKQEGVYKQ